MRRKEAPLLVTASKAPEIQVTLRFAQFRGL